LPGVTYADKEISTSDLRLEKLDAGGS